MEEWVEYIAAENVVSGVLAASAGILIIYLLTRLLQKPKSTGRPWYANFI